MGIIGMLIAFGVGLVASRTTTLAPLSEKAYKKVCELKDSIQKKIDN